MDRPDADERSALDAPPTPQGRLSLRLVLAAVAALLVAVPFTLLALLVSRRVDWLQNLDRSVADALHPRVLGSPWLTDALITVQEASQPWRLYVVSAVVLVVLLVRHRVRLASWLLVTTCTGWFLGYALKLVVQRARPSFPDPVELAPGYSFPSGHAVGSVIFAGTMVLLLDRVLRGGWRVAAWLAAGLFVLLVGFDRVALGVHYVSDVLAGWVVGGAVVVATVAAFSTWQRHEHGARGGTREGPLMDAGVSP